MKNTILNLFVIGLLAIGCTNNPKTAPSGEKPDILSSLYEYQDTNRNRTIPIAIMQTTDKKIANKIPILFSHGYGMNKGDAYVNDYIYLLDALAENGYFVVSIQHELTTDELLSTATPIREVRMPNWKRGADNIDFVLKKLKTDYPDLKFNKTVLLGHSNGGDQSVLFAHQHPELIDKLITLDNRRMDFPRVSKPKIYSLRSVDFPADEGVLPTEEAQKKLGMTIQPTTINHDRMDQDANEEERKFIINHLLQYLHEK